jgi:Zn-dependent protease with chaperone function
VRLRGLQAQDFQFRGDRLAMEVLKKTPGMSGLEFLMRKAFEHGFEPYLHIQNIADSVQVTPRQCPEIYALLQEACAILDVPEPELYLKQHPQPNAFTFGSEKPFIVLQTGIVDLLTEEELMGVIGHELGHIKCGHVLYLTLARSLAALLTLVGNVTFGMSLIVFRGLLVALLEWMRKAETSADRAELLVVQNSDVVVSVNMKLAGGSPTISEKLDRDAFLQQSDELKDLEKDDLKKLYKLLQLLNRTHPFLAVRAREALDWANGGEYEALLRQYAAPEYEIVISPYACSHCGSKVATSAAFCHKCGARLATRSEEPLSCRHCGVSLQEEFAFCPQCGTTRAV